MMVDLSAGQVLYSREADRRFVPASVTKVMTAYTAFRLIDEGKLNPATRFEISRELEDEWGGEGSTMFLQAGDRPTIGELLLGATTISGNDACVAIAQAAVGSLDAWTELMNRDAAELGMRDTHFGSANGYPDEGRTFTTAHDLAILGEALTTQYPDLYRRYFGHRTLTWREITQTNHEPLTGRVEGGDGMKTGFTNEAGYTFLGSGERHGRRLVLVLAGAPTGRARDNTARDFLEWGFDSFEHRRLAPAGTVIGAAEVQDGARDEVPLRSSRPVAAAIPQGHKGAIHTTIRYHGPVAAPIMEGEEIATLRVEIDGLDPLDIPLEAAETVPKAGFFARIGNGIRGFLT